ncbi:hypothetical protein IW261DRAFT_1511639 [Armillaria novae-zelandiae]|uniref:Uncharacterized protein n=1 Tax=Armillaria novae-zelandiae TaxID=153914 RepID=A0AA39NTB3_9AGAR|nr:hypothetical protein IW261DRAFT_1511639 [Armillaria novae-zelandiae]
MVSFQPTSKIVGACRWLVVFPIMTLFTLETLGQETDIIFHIVFPIVVCYFVSRMRYVALNRVFVIW